MKFQKFSRDGQRLEMEELDKESLSEFTLKRYLNRGQQIALIVKKYQVGTVRFGFSNITLEKDANLQEHPDKYTADLMFDLQEYPFLEGEGRTIHRNGFTLEKVQCEILKEDIFAACVIPNGK